MLVEVIIRFEQSRIGEPELLKPEESKSCIPECETTARRINGLRFKDANGILRSVLLNRFHPIYVVLAQLVTGA